jgi:putative flippase GtrA
MSLQLNSFPINIGIIKKIKFIIVGGSTAGIYFGLLFLFYDIVKLDKNISVTLSYFSSICFHFSMNKFFVFREKEITTLKFQLMKYIVLTAINYLINLLVVNIFSTFNISIYLGVACATMITLVITYLSMSRLIFFGIKD